MVQWRSKLSTHQFNKSFWLVWKESISRAFFAGLLGLNKCHFKEMKPRVKHVANERDTNIVKASDDNM